MFRIDPNGLYGRAELIEGFRELGIDFDAWVARVKPFKRFRLAWLGSDLMDALRRMPDLREHQEVSKSKTGRLVGLPRSKPRNAKKNIKEGKLVAGLWTQQELGL